MDCKECKKTDCQIERNLGAEYCQQQTIDCDECHGIGRIDLFCGVDCDKTTIECPKCKGEGRV